VGSAAGGVVVIVASRPRAAKTGQYVALSLYVLFLGFPLLWMLSVSFKGPRELVELYPSLIPSDPTFENYRIAFTENGLVRAAFNSLKVAVATSVLTIAMGLPAAYVLARRPGILTRIGLGWILLSQMFPLILIIIPLFLLLQDLHLTNTHAGLVLVYNVWALPFVLWMLYSYVKGIPRELEEAAAVDGATRFQILRGIIAPLLAPGIVVTALFAFITSWNEFFFALVVIQSPELPTLPLRLAQFVGIEGIVRLGPLAASALLATLPSLIIFVVIQRWLTRGLLSGAVKG
jgi:multiple sugar transport system permease protein